MYLVKTAYLIRGKTKRGSGALSVLTDQAVIIIRPKPPVQAVIKSATNPAMARKKSIA